jgi:hypothetical protein
MGHTPYRKLRLICEPSWLGCLKVRSDVAVSTGMTTFFPSFKAIICWLGDRWRGAEERGLYRGFLATFSVPSKPLYFWISLYVCFWDVRVRVWSARPVWRSPAGSPAMQRRRPGMYMKPVLVWGIWNSVLAGGLQSRRIVSQCGIVAGGVSRVLALVCMCMSV